MRQILICLFVIAAASCSTMSTLTPASVSYSDNAKQNFDLGEKALKEDKNAEALAFFDYVRNKYPYSKYASEADLRIADTYFSEEKWLEAADAYDFFIRFHPVHEKVAYAHFRVAKSHFNAMPSDFFIYPKSYTKDQTATREALAALDRYLTSFPKDENAKEAQEMRIKVREQSALLDMHVADFYVIRKKWRGAASRYEDIVKNLADTPSAKSAMLSLARIKIDRLNEKDEAKELLERLEKEYPESSEAKQAKSMLETI